MNSVNIEISGYSIEKLLAEGGMASVYLARQQSLDRLVAVKLLRKFDNTAQAQRFFNEGRILASLEHRNIITIFDLGVVGERHYLAMEYLQGGDLRRRIHAGMEPAQVLELVETLADCLSFVHQKGIIHRDIKPENILFRLDGSVVLTDFGVAKHMVTDSHLTLDGIALGSPYYLSPEQAQCRELDGRADIYSLGIITYEMLTGAKPFVGDSPLETIMAHLNSATPQLPAELGYYQPLLAKMIAVNPRDRFASAAELADYVRQLRASSLRYPRPQPLPVAGLQRAKTRLQSLKPFQHQLAAAAMLLLAVAMLILVFLWQPPLQDDDDLLAARSPSPPVETSRRATVIAQASSSGLPIVDMPEESRVADNPQQVQALAPNSLPNNAQDALRMADAILREPRLTVPKLHYAHDLYQIALKQKSGHPAALRGANLIANKLVAIEEEIQRYLQLAELATKNNRLTPPQPNNASDYYQRVLQLEPERSEALEGLARLADLRPKHIATGP